MNLEAIASDNLLSYSGYDVAIILIWLNFKTLSSLFVNVLWISSFKVIIWDSEKNSLNLSTIEVSKYDKFFNIIFSFPK